MNSILSVNKTYKIIKKNNIKHAFLHCVNLYPTNFKLVRLGRITKFQNIFKNSIIGYSDHTEQTQAALT